MGVKRGVSWTRNASTSRRSVVTPLLILPLFSVTLPENNQGSATLCNASVLTSSPRPAFSRWIEQLQTSEPGRAGPGELTGERRGFPGCLRCLRGGRGLEGNLPKCHCPERDARSSLAASTVQTTRAAETRLKCQTHTRARASARQATHTAAPRS